MDRVATKHVRFVSARYIRHRGVQCLMFKILFGVDYTLCEVQFIMVHLWEMDRSRVIEWEIDYSLI